MLCKECGRTAGNERIVHRQIAHVIVKEIYTVGRTSKREEFCQVIFYLISIARVSRSNLAFLDGTLKETTIMMEH